MVNISSAPLKCVFFTHFLLTIWGSESGWLPVTYIYYNLVFLATLLWGIHSRESEEPIFMSLAINLLAFVLDIIEISVYWPDHSGSHMKFSIVMAIFNLILRPASAIILLRILNERTGNINAFGVPNLSNYFGAPGSPDHSPYENIDQKTQHSVPQNSDMMGSPHHGSYNADIIPPH